MSRHNVSKGGQIRSSPQDGVTGLLVRNFFRDLRLWASRSGIDPTGPKSNSAGINKYRPHQGAQEKARRVRQLTRT